MHALKKCWPVDFHAIDIIPILHMTKKYRPQGNGICELFKCTFSTKFKSTTFYSHHACWDAASESEQQLALAGGHTEAGLGSTFMDCNAAPDIDLKLVHRHLKQSGSENDSSSEPSAESSSC